MCGLVAFSGSEPDGDVLARAAIEAGARGPHSHGWAWYSPDGWQRTVGQGRLGPPSADLTLFPAVLGHSRLATCGSRPGDAPPVSESQPFVSGPVAVAHNGTLDPTRLTPGPVVVDSEAILAALLAGWTLPEVLARIPGTPQAVIAATGRRLTAARQGANGRAGHPLFRLDRPEGVYVGSRRFDADCVLLPEGVTVL